MKKGKKIFSGVLVLSVLVSLFAVVTPVSAEAVDLTDSSNSDCVGTLTENFDGLANANALYRSSGEGILSGTWQRSARGTGRETPTFPMEQ